MITLDRVTAKKPTYRENSVIETQVKVQNEGKQVKHPNMVFQSSSWGAEE